jgi:hypothetical protein
MPFPYLSRTSERPSKRDTQGMIFVPAGVLYVQVYPILVLLGQGACAVRRASAAPA